MHTRPWCTIVPPYIGDSIEQNGTEAQKLRVRKAMLIMERIRGKRDAMVQPAIEPSHGEQREVRDAEGTTGTNGPIVRREDTRDTGDPSIDYAYDHAGVSFDFFYDLFDRKGADGGGVLLRSIIHYAEQQGHGWDNAAFDGEQILVGDGDIFPAFYKSPGVFYHEWGHFFTQETCGLVYTGQAGGNNEHGSDWVAAVTEQWHLGQSAAEASWLIGPELFTEGLSGRALRDMRHPGTAYDDRLIGKDPQIQTADQYRAGMDPHISSAIGNKAFVEAALQAGGNTWETVAPVWYDAWTRRMNKSTDFEGLAVATVNAAIALHGAQSPIHLAVLYGWETVKVKVSPTPDPTPPPAPAPESPCLPEFEALMRDPTARAHLAALANHPMARRLITRVRAFRR